MRRAVSAAGPAVSRATPRRWQTRWAPSRRPRTQGASRCRAYAEALPSCEPVQTCPPTSPQGQLAPHAQASDRD
eukprot:6204817-Pleurochrysis_carterae.AAC.1